MDLTSRPIHRISLFANGDVFLNGRPTTQGEIAAALDSGPREAIVWYYRENAAAAAPPHALEVLRLVTDRKLPIRLFTKPDFSDTDLPSAAGAPAQVFAAARQRAAQAQLLIVRPDYRLLGFPALPKQSIAKQALDEVERILSSKEKRNVAVLADTSWTMTGNPTLQTAAAGIPFMGLLIGLACIGHAVWVFDAGSASTLGSACAEADLLIVDDTRLELLPPDWNPVARASMRMERIFVYKRETRQLLPAASGASEAQG